MTNHIHLAVQEGEESLSRIIQNFAFRYAQKLNWSREEIGHVFQGRFKALRVESERYLLQLVQYIHLNPCRAGMVRAPEDYKWSGHNGYLGTDPYVWLESHSVLSRFSQKRGEAVRLYKEFVASGIGTASEFDFKVGTKSGIIGSEEFVGAATDEVGLRICCEEKFTLNELIDKICQTYKVSSDELLRPNSTREIRHVRAMLALLVRECSHLKIVDLGKYLNREPSGLIHSANRILKYSHNDKELDREIQRLRELLSVCQV